MTIKMKDQQCKDKYTSVFVTFTAPMDGNYKFNNQYYFLKKGESVKIKDHARLLKNSQNMAAETC